MSERCICLGDSITEGIGDEKGLGWVGRLANAFSKEYPDTWRFLNLGIAGDTSIDIKHRLVTEVLPREPSRLIIAAGINDTTYRCWPHATGSKVNISYAKDIWRQTLEILKRNKINTMFLGLTCADEQKLPLVWMPLDDQDKGHLARNADIKAYEQMLGKEVTDAGFLFIPMFERVIKTGYPSTLADGLHPDAKGYDIMARIIKSEGIRNGFLSKPPSPSL